MVKESIDLTRSDTWVFSHTFLKISSREVARIPQYEDDFTQPPTLTNAHMRQRWGGREKGDISELIS